MPVSSPPSPISSPIVVLPQGSEPLRFDQALARFCGVSRTEARRIIAQGGAFLDGARVKVASRMVGPGSRLQAHVLPRSSPDFGSKASLGREPEVLFEDRWLVAVYKPAGVPTQATRQGDRGTVESFLRQRFGRPVHLPHRLDVPASGILIAAHQREAAHPLQTLFSERRMVRIYRAVVEGKPELAEGELHHFAGMEGSRRRAYTEPPFPDSPEMILRYRVEGEREGRCLLWVRLLTGRTHQIRLQLSAMGWAVQGDGAYGQGGGRLALHASELTFRHPILGGKVDLSCPLPLDFPWQGEAPSPPGISAEV